MVILRLRPDEWVTVPGTPIELNSEHDTMVRRDAAGSWDLTLVTGGLVARIVLPDGRRSWPYPVTPLPRRA